LFKVTSLVRHFEVLISCELMGEPSPKHARLKEDERALSWCSGILIGQQLQAVS